MGQHRTLHSQRDKRVPLYEEITKRIISELEAGRLPWVQPWGTARCRRPPVQCREPAAL